MVDLERTRDLFMVAAIFGVFGFAWAGWAQEDPPPRARALLGVLAGASLLVGAAGGYLAWRHWDDPSALSGAEDGIHFGIIVGIETAVSLIGSAVLAVIGHGRRIAAWVSLVVGLHFIPLVLLFDNLTLLAPAVAMVTSAALAWRSSRTPPSAVTGLVNAPVLLLTAAANLALALA
ncbi:hypothetical protein [Nocardioides lijunqiniae]|uniref:hypothetical protein n=1 Tax=Nocardioides lijunqiniae TaxID=2760832 RepID=UPI00187770D4|nr:hypothetical protein [Nocardioides lijunqiniae]